MIAPDSTQVIQGDEQTAISSAAVELDANDATSLQAQNPIAFRKTGLTEVALKQTCLSAVLLHRNSGQTQIPDTFRLAHSPVPFKPKQMQEPE
jgi:hypothetical protein